MARRDDRPPMVVAMTWVHRLTSISLEMALPPLGGYWLDDRWGTRPVFVAIGAILGFGMAMWHLLKLVSDDNERRRNDRPPKQSRNPS